MNDGYTVPRCFICGGGVHYVAVFRTSHFRQRMVLSGTKNTWSEMARRNCVLQVYVFFPPVKTHQEIKNDSKNTCREIQVDSMSFWQFLSLDTYPTQTKYILGLFRGGFFVLNKDDFVILRRSCGSVQAPDAQDLFRSQRKAGWIVDLKRYRQGDRQKKNGRLRLCHCKKQWKMMSGICVDMYVSCIHDLCWKKMF